MRIALPVAGDSLCMHFGHCERFEIFDVDLCTKKILKKESMTAPPHEPGLLPILLKEKGANVVIAGGMGIRAQGIFNQNGIDVLVGVDAGSGSPEEIVKSFLGGSLKTGSNVCDH